MQYKQPTSLQVRHLGHFKPWQMEVFGHLLVGTVYFAALSIACWPDIIFDLPFASIAVLDGRAGSIHAMGGCDREQRSLICNDNSPDDCYKTRNDHSKHRTAFHSAAADEVVIIITIIKNSCIRSLPHSTSPLDHTGIDLGTA
jgi:hypothetical protein